MQSGPQVIDWCRANDIDFILGLALTTTLRKHVADLEISTTARPYVRSDRRASHFRASAARTPGRAGAGHLPLLRRSSAAQAG
ncbi:transposase [Mesorhizobium sp. M0894]|uniref:hypothetical protein n=1 Tax=unclassified Mesorhizobium TaxID=325217 RepID=UPI0033387EFF